MNKEYIISFKPPLVKDGSRGFSGTLRFLPLLILYIFIVLVAHNGSFLGDEGRYVMFATNLSKGYYSPLGEIYLWNGPGYPIVLLPFVVLKLPWLAAKLLNPLLLFAAILYFYNALLFYVRERAALFYSFLLGIYPPFCRYIYMLLTEQLVIFLVCGFIYHFCKLHREDKCSWIQLLTASFYLGYLALTKIFFGYVILTGLLLFSILYIQQRKKSIKRTLLFYLIALILCMPYLSYTYSLTGKIFYWGNSGGLSLYLMSSPYEEEFGDWAERNADHHRKVYSKLEGLSNIERDDAFKKLAVKNISQHPVKYIKNWAANIGRLWFNYPFSYTNQKLSNYFYILPNMFILVLWILCVYPTFRGRELIPYEIYVLMLFTLISFGGMSPLDGENRYLWPLIPLFILWISFVLCRILKIEIRNQENTSDFKSN
jgi:hypothetical protein